MVYIRAKWDQLYHKLKRKFTLTKIS